MADKWTDICRADPPSLRLDSPALIGRSFWKQMLPGCIPSDDGREAEGEYFPRLHDNTVILLTGAPGTGKRTLERAFAGTASDFYRYCRVPEGLLSGKEAEKTLRLLFAELTGYGAAAGNDEAVEGCYVSLGDITGLGLDNALAQCAAKLREKGTGFVIVTAVFDGEAGELPPSLRREVLVCSLAPPDEEERRAYFRRELDAAKRWLEDGTGIPHMAEATAGMTFAELGQLMQMLEMALKQRHLAAQAERTLEMLQFEKALLTPELFDAAVAATGFVPQTQAHDLSSQLAAALAALPSAAAPAQEADAGTHITLQELLDDDPNAGWAR